MTRGQPDETDPESPSVNIVAELTFGSDAVVLMTVKSDGETVAVQGASIFDPAVIKWLMMFGWTPPGHPETKAEH